MHQAILSLKKCLFQCKELQFRCAFQLWKCFHGKGQFNEIKKIKSESYIKSKNIPISDHLHIFLRKKRVIFCWFLPWVCGRVWSRTFPTGERVASVTGAGAHTPGKHVTVKGRWQVLQMQEHTLLESM